jgi:hypothetical protein
MDGLMGMITNPWFYVAVAIASVVINFVWRFIAGRGKLA